MVAGGERIPIVLFQLEPGISESLRIFEEHSKSLGELVVLLDESLIVNFF